MNPLEIFPEEVWTQIFSSLKGKNLLQSSLVSKDCYRIIGRSAICMEKLSICSRDDHEAFESLMASSRLYQHFRCYLKNEDVTAEHIKQWTAIVNTFSKSLISIKVSHDIESKSSLPNLKELLFSDSGRERRFPESLIIPNGLLTKVVDLRKLEVDFQWLDKMTIMCLSSFFMENSTLRVLTTKDSRPMRLIEPKRLKMKLEKFNVYTGKYGLSEHNFHFININEFFMAQSSSLNTVQCTFSPEVMKLFISNFPNLHTLAVQSTIQDYSHFGSAIPNYPINKSIKTLTLDLGLYSTIIENFRAHVIAIITNLYSLEKLNICHFNQEFLDIILCCKSLKTVEYEYVDSDVNEEELKSKEIIFKGKNDTSIVIINE